MAAATVASSQSNLVGIKRLRTAVLTEPADTNTWNTGLASIENLQVTAAGAVAAADSTGWTISGGVVTFSVVGTARDLNVAAIGL